MEDDFLDASSADQTSDDSFIDEKPFEFGIRLEIDNFSKIPIDEKILSPPCVVHNLAWRIMIRRTEQSGKSRLGYFLVCDPDSTKLNSSWSCEASARLYIINREDPIDHFSREIRHLFCSEENDWGFTTFCYWDYVCDSRNKYILNDSVKFDVCVVVDYPEGVDVSHSNFINIEKPQNNRLYRKIQIKNENHNALEATVKKLKSDVMLDVDALASNLLSELKALKSDLAKSFADQLNTTLDRIKLQELAEAVSVDSSKSESKSFSSSESKMFVPLKSISSLESESENAAAVPQMRTGSTVHWFGPSQHLPMTEDDEIEDELVRLSIEERKKDEAVSRENEKNVSNDDTNEKKQKVETIIEQSADDEVKKNEKTSAESTFDDDAEILDTSTDDFEIIYIDECNNLGFESDKISNAFFETIALSALDGLKSHTAENIVKTDTIIAAATKNDSGILDETNDKMSADHCRNLEGEMMPEILPPIDHRSNSEQPPSSDSSDDVMNDSEYSSGIIKKPTLCFQDPAASDGSDTPTWSSSVWERKMLMESDHSNSHPWYNQKSINSEENNSDPYWIPAVISPYKFNKC